jgi:hypothetical protein
MLLWRSYEYIISSASFSYPNKIPQNMVMGNNTMLQHIKIFKLLTY